MYPDNIINALGKFIISNMEDGKYCYFLLASNGETILAFYGYESKEICERVIRRVREVVLDAESFERHITDDYYWFCLYDYDDPAVIGMSGMYDTAYERNTMMDKVKRTAIVSDTMEFPDCGELLTFPSVKPFAYSLLRRMKL